MWAEMEVGPRVSLVTKAEWSLRGRGPMTDGEGEPGMSCIPEDEDEGPAGGPPALLKSGGMGERNSHWDRPGSVGLEGTKSSFLVLW